MNLFTRCETQQQTRPRSTCGILGIFVVVGLLMAGCSSLQKMAREATPTPLPTLVSQVSADQVAQAMQEDRFFSAYGHSQLMIRGKVASISQQGGHAIVEFQTAETTRVQCDLGTHSYNVHPGDQITLEEPDPRSNASREPGIVFLKNCIIP